MSKQSATGIRAAKGLLGLLDENSAEDFEAAMAILGNQQELVDILQLLTNYQKQGREADPQPDPKAKTVEDLQEVVRVELLGLGIAPSDVAHIAQEILDPTMRFFTPPKAKLEDVVPRVLEWIDTEIESPREQARKLIELVVHAAHVAGPEHEEKVADSLRALTVEALAGNFVMFSDLRSLGDIRLRWSEKSLTHLPREPRRQFASRLLNDAQKHAPESYREILKDLLMEGLRSPTDTATTLLRHMKLQKASVSLTTQPEEPAAPKPSRMLKFKSPNPPPAGTTPMINKNLLLAKRNKQ